MAIIVFALWAFIALVVRADAIRRYGGQVGGHFFVAAAALPVLGLPYYLIFRIGHGPGVYPLDRLGRSMPWNAQL